MLKPRVIINADDLGLNAWTNDRIFEAFERGWISTATIMANMPAFGQAVERVHQLGLNDRIGLHTVLDAGAPLSDAMREIYGPDSMDTPRKLFISDIALSEAIGHEIRAQIQAARAAGLPLPHADSHHHLHTHWSILSQIIPVCLEEDVCSLRLAGNLLFPSAMQKRVYRGVVNRRIRNAGFITTQKFTYLDRFLAAEPSMDGDAVIELMVHPGVDEEFRLFQTPAFKRLLNNFKLISYSEYQRSLHLDHIPSDVPCHSKPTS